MVTARVDLTDSGASVAKPPKIVATRSGAAGLIPGGGPAGELAAALRVLMLARPDFAGPDHVLGRHLRMLVNVERLHAAGALVRTEPASGGGSAVEVACFDWVSANQASRGYGVTPRTMTNRCRSGDIPGAQLVPGLGWIIPRTNVPHLEINDDEDPC